MRHKGEKSMSNAPPFVSVKLPAALVNHAREAAQTMRRSVASQIEYWATLGKALEHAGLTTGDSQALIARQERAQYELREPSRLSPELEALHSHVLAVAQSGALNKRTRVEVEAGRSNSARAVKSAKPRKAA
jgi:ParD-like antitoxin of type II bacterial toxin-antitoxin system